MTKKFIAMSMLTLMAIGANAQEKKWYDTMKLSGYGMVQYQANDKKGDEQNSINLRLLRLILDGQSGDFDWRVQAQGSSNAGPSSATFNLVDLYAEWRRFDFLKVRVGQFKRAFTFENPTHPITQGWYSYAMSVNKLAGFGDRTGEKSSGGRDIGVQLQGDLIRVAGHPLLHYQVGVYNGEGINAKDKDNRKDIIGGMWVMPVKGLRIGGFGWTGSRGGYSIDGKTNQSVSKNRYAISAEWDKDDWTFRTEYIHSQGFGTATAGDGTNTIERRKGTKADGFYFFGIVPIIKNKLHVKARYDVYRDEINYGKKIWYDIGANGDVRTIHYEGGIDYMFNKNIMLNLMYSRVDDHTRDYNTMYINKYKYNMVNLELDFRF